ncbi:MAG: peptidoglycan-binding protein [Synergistaceae bacterium]|jgi:hypothetical protein|nr:peptidoglycan-binding protein [Synergistaceae bacterium]
MNGMKKFLIYTVVISFLILASYIVNEVREVRYMIQNPDVYVKNARAPLDVASASGDFVRPDAARRGVWSAPELAWLLRERIKLDVMEKLVDRGESLGSYNDMVEEYNILARIIEYRERDMKRAEDLVEERKTDIVSDALDESMNMMMPERVKLASSNERSRTIWSAQKYLHLMGLYQGALSGEENDETKYAIKTFQIGASLPVDGLADEELVSHLRTLWITRNTPSKVGF